LPLARFLRRLLVLCTREWSNVGTNLYVSCVWDRSRLWFMYVMTRGSAEWRWACVSRGFMIRCVKEMTCIMSPWPCRNKYSNR
jgi:hypothetical protein